MLCWRLLLQEPQGQLPPPPRSIGDMNSVYKYCNVPPALRGKVVAALYKAGKVKAEAEYQAFQLVLQAAEAQPEVCPALCVWHSSLAVVCSGCESPVSRGAIYCHTLVIWYHPTCCRQPHHEIVGCLRTSSRARCICCHAFLACAVPCAALCSGSFWCLQCYAQHPDGGIHAHHWQQP
jgi:hypothetical protein